MGKAEGPAGLGDVWSSGLWGRDGQGEPLSPRECAWGRWRRGADRTSRRVGYSPQCSSRVQVGVDVRGGLEASFDLVLEW